MDRSNNQHTTASPKNPSGYVVPVDERWAKVVRDMDNSRPLDVHRWSEHPEVHALIANLWERYFQDMWPDTGRPGKRPLGDHKRQLRVLILDLFVAWKVDPNLSIGVHMSNSGYRAGSRYNALHISPVIIDLVHRAHEVGLIGLWRGNEQARRVTRIWAEGTLIELFQRARFGVFDIASHPDRETVIVSRDREDRIILKGVNKYVEYEDTPDSIVMRNHMQRYNRLLHRTFIDNPRLEKPFVLRPAEASNQRDRWVCLDQNDKFSRRIFYRGQWQLGGRIHGGFWQRLPENERANLYINDLPVVEDDYAGTHVALLYGLEGWPLREDPYTLNLPSSYPANIVRKWVKSLVLVAINAPTERSAFNAFRQGQPTGSPAKRFKDSQLAEMLRAFERQHAAIARYLCSDKGVELMAIDGRITARIIEQFTDEGVPVLTVFDSYIVGGLHAEELRTAMRIAMDAEVPGAATNYDRAGHPYENLITKRQRSTGRIVTLAGGIHNVRRTDGYRARRDAFDAWRAKEISV